MFKDSGISFQIKLNITLKSKWWSIQTTSNISPKTARLSCYLSAIPAIVLWLYFCIFPFNSNKTFLWKVSGDQYRLLLLFLLKPHSFPATWWLQSALLFKTNWAKAFPFSLVFLLKRVNKRDQMCQLNHFWNSISMTAILTNLSLEIHPVWKWTVFRLSSIQAGPSLALELMNSSEGLFLACSSCKTLTEN